MADPLRIEKLRADHAVSGFDCGQEELNRFLSRFALVNLRAGAAQTYVALSAETVVGYYSLAVGEVVYQDAPDRLTKGLARHPVPIILLARLAVSSGSQGQGIGAGLLIEGGAEDRDDGREWRRVGVAPAGGRGVRSYAVNPNANSFLISFARMICFFVAPMTLGGPAAVSCFCRV